MAVSLSFLLGVLVFAGVSRPATAELIGWSQGSNSVLSIEVRNFRVENGSMEDGLRALRATSPGKILIGFEKVSRRPNAKEPFVSLAVSNATVGEILSDLCRQDPRYNYETVKGQVVHVYPVGKSSDPFGLLDMRISRFTVEGDMTPAGIIQGIASLAPELTSFLKEKKDEYFKRRGVSPGSPGSGMTGNMNPRVSLNLEGMTVREILNEVVLYSVDLSRNSKPDIGGNRIPPTSWIYEFVVDRNAPTGLGGTPRWIAF